MAPPPVEPRIAKLPFDELSWQDFERLVFRLASKNPVVEYCAPYGRPGQKQHGIDVYARLSGGGHICWQARNRQDVGASDITEAVDDFVEDKWAATAKRFVLCIRASLADTKVQDSIELEAVRLQERGIAFDAVDGMQLGEKLRSYPEIIHDFFGRNWVVAFAGEEAAAGLGRRLEARHLTELRRRLGEIYRAQTQQLDPGLNVEPGRELGRDIRKRFVVPDVDPANPFLEPSLEPEERPADELGWDDRAWQFDEYGDSGNPIDFGRSPSEHSETPSLAFDDWLLQGGRAMLMSGAPGSGKSTALRCLALDLLNTPELFPRLREQVGARIPLLIPFAVWSRLTAKEQRAVGLAEVVRETFRAFVPLSELEDSFLEALYDKRLLLLIDGLDEYADEQAARTTLSTIETFVRTNDVFTIATARPAGLRRLGTVSGYWRTARLIELSLRQQRDFATKLLGEQDGVAPVSVRVEQFFQQLEHSGRLQSLAGNPLLLRGLLSVAARRIILPNTRFELFEELIKMLLDVHPAQRATAASEVASRTEVFSPDDVRREALAKLAFEVQVGGADAGIGRRDARQVIEDFLADSDGGLGWSAEKARTGARELTDVDADTSGLLVERGPQELAFCHAAFREHLTGLELATWTLEDQAEFVSEHAGDPRWRAPILALLQSLNRRVDVERMLEAIRDVNPERTGSTDRLLLLAEGAFATGSVSGAVGRQAALDSLRRIESGTDDAERIELLGLALDGPRAGPVGEAIVARLGKWWPGVTGWQENFYTMLGGWQPTDELAETLELALRGDTNQLAAGASLARVFRGDGEVGDRLTALVHESVNPWVTAAALDALSRGWPESEGLDGWLDDAERSPSAQLRTVAAVARYRRGRRGDAVRDSLLRALGLGWNKFGSGLQSEITDALVSDWAHDGELHDACWAGVGRRGPPKRHIDHHKARSMLMRLHREDARVSEWVREEIESHDHFAFRGSREGVALLEPIVSEHANVRAAVEVWFEKDKFSRHDYEAAQLAAMVKSDAAKRMMMSRLKEVDQFNFWPVWSLLKGWGMDDPEVAGAVEPLVRLSPEYRQHIAEHIPAIVGSIDQSLRLLLEICELEKLWRADFVIRGLAALGDEIDDAEAVSAVLPHVSKRPATMGGEDALIARFHGDSRVRAFALERLREPSPPLAGMASVYSTDTEIAPLILQRAAPLPTVLRRHIARRATQRFDDDALGRVLKQCDLETDEHAMAQATVGLSFAALATQGGVDERVQILSRQLHSVGPGYDDRRAAAFGGLLALGRIDAFASATKGPDGDPLEIDVVGRFNDYGPVLELAAERWEDLKTALGETLIDRLGRGYGSTSAFWQAFAPYVGRSSLLGSEFLEYCENATAMLEASELLAVSRLSPGSTVLLDCCKRVLTEEFDSGRHSPLDIAQSTVLASKLLAVDFSGDASAVAAIVEASEHRRGHGGALVGLASQWPNHEIVVREYEKLLDGGRWPRLLFCVEVWLLSARGGAEQVVNAFKRYVTRPAASPWDFPEDALDAFRSRLERDAKAAQTFELLARDHDEPSARASTARLLASMPAMQGQNLAGELLAAECRRPGPPRFALDVLTNRIRPARDIMREALGESGC